MPRDIAAIMRGNKGKDTRPELLLRRALWAAGVRGYRKHTKLPGKPDLLFKRPQLAVFVHGCYWHGCPTCGRRWPRQNLEFWTDKFRATSERDSRHEKELRDLGFRVLVIWECELKGERLTEAINRVKELLA